MCTLVILRRPDHAWPVLVAANRDEQIARPWRPPARHWPDRPDVIADRPDVIAGIDELAGGTWLGLNDHGVMAAVLNGRGTLGPRSGFRSRGELPLEALEHADAIDAIEALGAINPEAYRACHLVIADNRDAAVISVLETEAGHRIARTAIPPGVSLLTSRGLNDLSHPRAKTYLPQFRAAKEPEPAQNDSGGDWTAWRHLMASRLHDPVEGPDGAMTIMTDRGYGTVCSSLIALSAPNVDGKKPVFLFA
ncbi:MAG: hypothetical protein K0Q70_2196, partial [Rhodospirillales bacterium]|nr:hypothetical protein [Rhodospirillales bacterium]